MTMDLRVRAASVDDVQEAARLHVESWRETYRGLMPDQVLDDPTFLERREAFWTAVTTDSRFVANTAAVAETDGSIVGIALAGPVATEDGESSTHLHLLYTYAAVHGSGAGIALLNAVIGSAPVASLWVADPNPRAQAFYRKHGFAADGEEKTEDGVREIRMVRRIE